MSDPIHINEQIRVPELRVIGPAGENFGIISTREAQKRAKEYNLDLIVVSPNAEPPVAKIADYGKYMYAESKKMKEQKARSFVSETKEVQVKIGTGENDLQLKAKNAASWLKEGHQVRVNLYLWGRYKYMEFDFLKERLERFLAIIPESFKIKDEIKKSPKGLAVTLERAKAK